MSALTSNAGTGAAGGKPPAERLASIGRVFENQGHYDQAEVMYRRALKQSPNDSVIRDQLAGFTEHRKGREFGPDRTETALAMADAVRTGHAFAQLAKPEQDVRASAAVTLGDFASGDDVTLAELTKEDNDPGVRDAALAAILRKKSARPESAAIIPIQPARWLLRDDP